VLVTNPTVWQELEEAAADVRNQISVVTARPWDLEQRNHDPGGGGFNDFHPKEQGYNTGYLITVAGQRVFHAATRARCPSWHLGAVDVTFPIGGTYTSDRRTPPAPSTK
jgi:hypothetical protein